VVHRRGIFGDDARMNCSTHVLVGLIGLTVLVAAGSGCTRQKNEAAPAPVEADSMPAPASAPLPQRTVTPDGLVIEDLTIGTGRECAAGDTIEMNFTAMLADGTVYDSSEMRKRSLLVPLSSPSLIRGLKEGIPGLREGGKRRLEIPWKLAYGINGREPVPPKTDLIFVIELVAIK